MKANILSDEYDYGLVQFLEFVRRNLPDNKEIFYFHYKICRNTKKNENKYSIIYVVMEFVNIIRHKCGMVK